ncbi:MAG: hypothetical protein JW828_05320 [Sedimentisphaerales bacterium]|nr:hypothetical protein [Sedimentisphaerales bacterium]
MNIERGIKRIGIVVGIILGILTGVQTYIVWSSNTQSLSRKLASYEEEYIQGGLIETDAHGKITRINRNYTKNQLNTIYDSVRYGIPYNPFDPQKGIRDAFGDKYGVVREPYKIEKQAIETGYLLNILDKWWAKLNRSQAIELCICVSLFTFLSVSCGLNGIYCVMRWISNGFSDGKLISS